MTWLTPALHCSLQSSAASPSEVEEAPLLPAQAPPASLDVREPAVELRLSGHDHHVLLVQLDGRLWLADVGFGGANPPLPVLLPEGAERFVAPPPDQTAAAPYEGADWVAAAGLERAAQRMCRFRLRCGLPGKLLAPPDPAALPRSGQRLGYYLQHLEGDGGWRDVYFFRHVGCGAPPWAEGALPVLQPMRSCASWLSCRLLSTHTKLSPASLPA